MAMGDVIDLQLRRARRVHAPIRQSSAYYFDVSCPMSYLASERVERALGQVDWIAVDASAVVDPGAAPECGLGAPSLDHARAQAELHARALRLPLVWPERFSEGGARARRAASFACELGAGAPFALAAGRLAYCGGFDLDDPETLAEAAAASGVPLTPCLEAAAEHWRDDELREIGRSLWAQGVRELPAVALGEHWFGGVTGLMAAGARLRDVCAARQPLAPVG
ncbi:MAG TPA: DsbA family protein [Solirubrobacteraceae bacterium]|nr:DsbA family protein [Solirubrobacteraceae bacterium]